MSCVSDVHYPTQYILTACGHFPCGLLRATIDTTIVRIVIHRYYVEHDQHTRFHGQYRSVIVLDIQTIPLTLKDA